MKQLLLISLVVFGLSCRAQVTILNSKQPNILWIVTEDISPTLSFYGDSIAKTPNLDALAKESMIYDNAFATVGVCAPARSSIITGMYPTSIGTMHMRTGIDIMSWGARKYKNREALNKHDINRNPIGEYAAVIPDYVKCFPEYLKEAGYFCSNNQKTDYQFAAPVTTWNQNNKKAHWRNRPKNKPFFSVFNINTTHESQLWKKNKLPLTVDPKKVKVPPYLPDNETTRKTIARHYSNVELMDAEVGAIIKQLKDDGLYNNTIIFFYSDHGGPLPRQKREVYDSGLKVPFLIKDVNGAIGRTDRMISFVDFAPTMLSLANVKPLKYMEGKAFMGPYASKERTYIFGSSDRFDEYTDRTRAIRNKRFLYLKNDFPEKVKYKDISYRKNIAMMPIFLKLKNENKLGELQRLWFQKKTKEELYDCKIDPHNINNLAANPKFKLVLSKMRTTLIHHQKNKTDLGLLPEAVMINNMWPNFKQPITASVVIKRTSDKISLSSKTKGASIAYFISNNANEKLDFNSDWKLYCAPIKIEKEMFIYSMAQRIGFKESVINIEEIF